MNENAATDSDVRRIRRNVERKIDNKHYNGTYVNICHICIINIRLVLKQCKLIRDIFIHVVFVMSDDCIIIVVVVDIAPGIFILNRMIAQKQTFARIIILYTQTTA